MAVSDEERQWWRDAAEQVATAGTERFVALFARAGHEVSRPGRAALRKAVYELPAPVTDALYAEIGALVDRLEAQR